MLLQFAVENYKSIAEKQVLSWMAAPDEWHPVGQVFEVEGLGKVLRSLVIYGANASGKSNLVEALRVGCLLAFKGIGPGEKLPVSPHRLDPAWVGEPSRFELEWWLDGVHYAYGLIATTERVVEEWLYRVNGDVDHKIFVRRDAGDRPHVEFGDGLQVDDARRAFYNFVAEGTRPEQPLLAELRARNATELQNLFHAFHNIRVTSSNDRFSETLFTLIALRSPSVVQMRSELLRDAKTGVTDIRLEATDPALQERLDAGKEFTRKEAAELTIGSLRGVIRATYLHRGRQGLVPLTLNDLSDGTRRLLQLGYEELLSDGQLRVVDELDRSLHTQLTRFLVERLNRSERQAQFLFTTHDTNLLDAQVFGRDAIWFVEKDEFGASRFYSLAEFKREQLDELTGRIEEGYLQGRFGAIPFSSDPTRLGWSRQ